MSLPLPRPLLSHETLMLAVLHIAREFADTLDVSVEAPLAESCRAVGANRTSVYEQVGRVLASLEELATARPGRPSEPAATRPNTGDPAAQQLTIELLEHRLDHPGAMVRHRGRTHHSSCFRRFLLAKHDDWTGTLETFAAAVRVPLDRPHHGPGARHRMRNPVSARDRTQLVPGQRDSQGCLGPANTPRRRVRRPIKSHSQRGTTPDVSKPKPKPECQG